MSRLDWRRTRQIRASESKYGSGIVLSNGEVTPITHEDDRLARRAKLAMRRWLKTLPDWQRNELIFTCRTSVSMAGG